MPALATQQGGNRHQRSAQQRLTRRATRLSSVGQPHEEPGSACLERVLRAVPREGRSSPLGLSWQVDVGR